MGLRYLTHASVFGDFAIVWTEEKRGVSVRRVLLPGPDMVRALEAGFPGAEEGASGAARSLASKISRFLRGDDVAFSLRDVDMQSCGEFQQRVLRAEREIPRGYVSTYGAIAAHIGVPGGARAVGRALATNPFPVVVPCHRAIRRDGGLGGYQGGVAMKRTLLEYEGVVVSPGGRVVAPRLYYETD